MKTLTRCFFVLALIALPMLAELAPGAHTSGAVTINAGKLSMKVFGALFATVPDCIQVWLYSQSPDTAGYVVSVSYRTPAGTLMRVVDATGTMAGSTAGLVRFPVDLDSVASIESVEVMEIPPGKALTFQ